jgi:hypothetical protein
MVIQEILSYIFQWFFSCCFYVICRVGVSEHAESYLSFDAFEQFVMFDFFDEACAGEPSPVIVILFYFVVQWTSVV